MSAVADPADAQDLWDYLRLGQPVQAAECILVFGGHDLGVAHRAVDLYHQGVAPRVLVSGGAANVPTNSRFSTEADAIEDILLTSGVPKSKIMIERLASNTSENFWFSAEMLRDKGLRLGRFVIVQKPYCERRTVATARRRWPARMVTVTSEDVTFDDYCKGDIPVQRIFSMIAGEILRLQQYADSGLIEIDAPVPDRLLDGARRLQASGFDARSMGARHVGANLR